MSPTICLISLMLSHFIYFTVAEHKYKNTIFENDDPHQFFAELKNEFISLGKELNTVGEKINTFRNDLNQQLLIELAGVDHDLNIEMEPISHYRDLTLKMLRKVSAKGADKEVQVDAVVTFLTEIISREIQDSTDIPPAEMKDGAKYECMSQGEASGLRSLKHVSTKVTSLTDSVDLRITYVFENLHLHYGLFYLQIWPWTSMRCALDVVLGKNEIEIVLNLPKVDALMKKVIRNECIIRLKDFSVNNVEYRSSRLTGESSVGNDIASSLIDKFLKMNQTMLKKRLEAKVLEEIHRTLRMSGNFVCNDQVFSDLILRKGGSLVHETESEDFKRYCGSGVEGDQKRNK